jgi:hypothetical protein
LEVVNFDKLMKLGLENDLGKKLLIGTALIDQQGLTTVVEFNKCSKKLLIDVTLRSSKSIELDEHENTYEFGIVGLFLVVGDGHFEDGLDFVGFIGFNGRVEGGFLDIEFKLPMGVEEMLKCEMSGQRESHCDDGMRRGLKGKITTFKLNLIVHPNV